MNFKAKKRKTVQLDITPLVDTVFILLIFFALSLQFSEPAASLSVRLPGISKAEAPGPSTAHVITITKKNEIFLNQSGVSAEMLSKELRSLHDKWPELGVVIQADKKVFHGKVVEIMDICKQSGFTKLSIAAELKK